MRIRYLILCVLFLFSACTKEITNDPGEPPDESGTAYIRDNVYDGFFLYGSNMGWLNMNWQDVDVADILIGNPGKNINGVGVTSLRLKLHEVFVESWGYDVHTGTFSYYQSIGAKNNVCFIGEDPCDTHRERKQYIQGVPSNSFENLYEPIWTADGDGTQVNPNNYYAVYVYELVKRYKDQIKFWEILNEPDLTPRWDLAGGETGSPGSWWDNDPSPADLINWYAPIQSYIRLLRVSYEVIKSVDPDAFICVGGIGYPSFLDAILRNTDNPDKGKVTDHYPYQGGAWFDCLSFHCYPMYSLRSWENNRHSDGAAEVLISYQHQHESVLRKYGYGNQYPRKEVIVTETNVPGKPMGDFIGSPEAQRNYLVKAAILGQKNGISGIYPYCVWDNAEQNGNGGEYDYMGFYKPLPDRPGGNLRVNDSGISWRTVSRMLSERRFDAPETAKLALPAGIEGGAFHSTRSNDYVYVLWAKTTHDLSETTSVAYSFPTSIRANKLNVTTWNGISTETNGSSINLTGSPVFVKCL